MANYIGVNNVAKKVKGYYIGVNGKARKVKKMYAGVNGVARLCYEESSVSNVAVTFAFYSSIALPDAITIYINDIVKSGLSGFMDDIDSVTLQVPIGASIRVEGEGQPAVPVRYAGFSPSSAFDNDQTLTSPHGVIFTCICKAKGQINFEA